ncbi:MAG: MFS transporter [Halieaceae bacterium]
MTVTGAAPVKRRELFGWAMYDFANSGYTTVVLTAIFNAYFVGVVAGGSGGLEPGTATLLWTSTIAVANIIVIFSAPIIGALADQRASKKRFLLITTVGCVIGTALLSLIGPGDYLLAMFIVLFGNVMFASGEYLVAAFLPEIADSEHMGRISGYGWSLGYVGGIITLGLCLAYVQWAQAKGLPTQQVIAPTLLITAAMFTLAAIPTFLFLQERSTPLLTRGDFSVVARAVLAKLSQSMGEVGQFKDLRRLLISITIYQAGVSTVIVLAAVYASEVMGFDTQQLLMLILVVNITSAIGAFLFGFFQDRIGSVRALSISLCLWIVAVVLSLVAEAEISFWIAGNLIGLAMGASQSIGRALVGQFAPTARTGEFFGLWSLANRVAALLGPMSYGLINYATNGDHRAAMLSTLAFLVAGLLLLRSVDEQRGIAAAAAELPQTKRQ